MRLHGVCLFAGVVLAMVTGGCATHQEKPPKCEGAYTPVNTRDKYPDLVEKDRLDSESNKGARKQ
jgi:hypothetical protein